MIQQDFIVSLAAGFTQVLLQHLGRQARGDPARRAAQTAYESAFAAMLRQAGSGLSQAELDTIAGVMERFLDDPDVAQALLDLGLAGAPPDLPSLEARWLALGGPGRLENIRFDFGVAMLAFQESLAQELLDEAGRADSPLANQVVVRRLAELQRQLAQLTALAARRPASEVAGPATLAAPASAPAPPRYHSCFISYSSLDQAFADRLYDDLRAAGVRCWYAPEDLAIGDKMRRTIYDAISSYDKLLVILSRNSVESDWVEREVERAWERERRRNDWVLFPVRLDDAVFNTEQAWAGDIRRIRNIGDFSRWQEPEAYARALRRVLRDLAQ